MDVRLCTSILKSIIVLVRCHQDIKVQFIILHVSFLQFDWQRAAVFQFPSGLKKITYFVDCHFFVIFVDCSLYFMRVFCNLISREQLFFSFQWFQKWWHKLYFCRDITEIYSITHDISIVTNFTRHLPLYLDRYPMKYYYESSYCTTD